MWIFILPIPLVIRVLTTDTGNQNLTFHHTSLLSFPWIGQVSNDGNTGGQRTPPYLLVLARAFLFNIRLPLREPQTKLIAAITIHTLSMDHYHWFGYQRHLVTNHPFARIHHHQGSDPMHRLCSGVKIGSHPFQFLEAHIWVCNEKWNIMWVEDETWMPQDSTITMTGSLPHGFQKVHASDSQDAYLNVWLRRHGRDFYPFSAELRHQGYACWANSQRFAICAQRVRNNAPS